MIEPGPMPDMILECGCLLQTRVVDGEKQFRVTPCELNCKVLKMTLEMAMERGKPVEFK